MVAKGVVKINEISFDNPRQACSLFAMKLIRGTYDGASEMAYFDKDIAAMSPLEMKRLLECILHGAATGEDHAQIMFYELARAEEAARVSASEAAK